MIEISFPADHPSGAGHFPGNPIIPGALLLDAVMQALGDRPLVIRSAKFHRAVRPGQALLLQFQPGPDGAITFACHLPDGLAASGRLEPK